MKRLFTKAFTAVLIFTLLMSNLCIQAKEALYEKYDYQEEFEYEDEIIGHALKSAVPKILLEYSARLRYKPVELDVDALANQVDLWYEELASQSYSEDEISQMLLSLIEENLYRYISYGAYKESDVSGMGHGSGVVLSDDGYIATNAHVATLDEETKLNMYMYSLSESVLEDLYVMLEDLSRYGIELTEEDTEYLRDMLLYSASENAQVKDEKTVLKACFSSPDGETDMESSKTYDAELIEIGTQEGIEGLTQDTAILKIDAKNLIALPLSDSYPESNSHIVSAGYPAVADEIFSNAGSEASTLSVSIGTGKVARTIDIDGEDYKAIEISSTISNGNSGGPSVDKHLQIEGLNTYASNTDVRFAYMISAEFVKSLTKGLDIGLGEASKTFLTGLQLLQQGYGPAAQECFEYVKELQKDTPYIEHLIALAEDAPQTEHPADKDTEAEEESFFEMIISNPVYLTISIVAVVLILAIIIITIILICKSVGNKKKKKKSTDTDFSRSYVPTSSASALNPTMIDDTLINGDNNQQSQASSNETGYSQQNYYPQSNASSQQTAYFDDGSASLNSNFTQYEAYPTVSDAESTPPEKPRLKSTMKKSEPEQAHEPKEPDEHFHSQSEL